MARSRAGFFLLALLVAAALLASPVVARKHTREIHEDPATHKKKAREAVGRSFDGWVHRHVAKYESTRTEPDLSAEALGTAAAAAGRTIVVDQSGRGHFKKVQQAVNAVPDGNNQRVTIIVRPGVYREKIVVPSTKPYITFQGSGRNTILVWADTAGKAGGTSKSASTAIEADHFIAMDITFANSAPAPSGGAVGMQAVALRIKGDMGAFYRCSFFGAQDTLYDQAGRHYFQDCLIQGSIDFIFGDGQSLYENCHLNSIAKQTSGSFTAQKRGSNSELSGFSFLGCTLTGSGTIYLGRAWGPYSRVVFIRCFMENIILPQGWFDWGDSARQKTVFYGQFRCSGPGANEKGRVKWSRELTPAQAAPFSSVRFIDGQRWLGK